MSVPKKKQPGHIETINRARQIKDAGAKLPKLKCPHCDYKWRPYKKEPKKCPNCRRDLNPESKVNVSKYVKRNKLPDLLTVNRFSPSIMKQLVDAKVYKYTGIPRDLPRLTAGREVQRMANLKLADRYLGSDVSQGDFGKVFKFTSRAAIFFRLAKGFKVLAEYGAFVLTPGGKEKIATQRRRAEIAAEAKHE